MSFIFRSLPECQGHQSNLHSKASPQSSSTECNTRARLRMLLVGEVTGRWVPVLMCCSYQQGISFSCPATVVLLPCWCAPGTTPSRLELERGPTDRAAIGLYPLAARYSPSPPGPESRSLTPSPSLPTPVHSGLRSPHPSPRTWICSPTLTASTGRRTRPTAARHPPLLVISRIQRAALRAFLNRPLRPAHLCTPRPPNVRRTHHDRTARRARYVPPSMKYGCAPGDNRRSHKHILNGVCATDLPRVGCVRGQSEGGITRQGWGTFYTLVRRSWRVCRSARLRRRGEHRPRAFRLRELLLPVLRRSYLGST